MMHPNSNSKSRQLMNLKEIGTTTLPVSQRQPTTEAPHWKAYMTTDDVVEII